MRIVTAIVLLSMVGSAWAGPEDKLLARIKAVGTEGNGNQEAGAAFKELTSMGSNVLIPTLKAFDGASPIARNWLRSAAETIVQRMKKTEVKLPLDALEQFVLSATNSPVGRRVAFEILSDADPKVSERLLPQFVNDPSVEIRRDAIAAALTKAEPLIKSMPEDAKKELQRLFDSSRDQDQAESIAKSLKTLEVKADLTHHFGVVTQWRVAGPFDSKDGTGFDKAYPPESKIDPATKFVGKDMKEFGWTAVKTEDTYGIVDLNKVLGKHKDAAAYAVAELTSPNDGPVEIRIGSIAAVKIFLNGKQIFAREEYHHGHRFDQYVGLGKLQKGPNQIMLKVCQNNQTESWAQDWKFQVRVCDATGGRLPVTVAAVTK